MALKCEGVESASFYLPSGADIPITGAKSASNLMEEQWEEIEGARLANAIKIDEWFLWDTRSKVVLTEESFYEFTPHFRLGSTLFVFEHVDPKTGEITTTPAYCLTDASAWTVMRALLLWMGKNELIRPGSEWSELGKAALSFLASKKFGIYQDFTTSTVGPWNGFKVEMEDGLRPLELRLDGYKDIDALGGFSKIKQLSLDTTPLYTDAPKTIDSGGAVMLSEFVGHGGDITFSGETDLVEFVIDILGNVYKNLVWDRVAELMLVGLQPGTVRTREEVAEELGLDPEDVVFGKVDK
jgi:hypothetical protein